MKGIVKTEILTIIVLCSVLFFRVYGVFIVVPVFSLYALQLDYASLSLVGLALGIYSLTQALFQIPSGMLSDKIGRKPVIICGLLVFIVGCLICATAENIYIMLLGRFIQGAGVVTSSMMAFLADQVPVKIQTRSMALIGISFMLAFIVGYASSASLVGWFDFNGLFVFAAIASLLGLLLMLSYRFPVKVVKINPTPLVNFWSLIKSKKLNTTLLTIFTAGYGMSLFIFKMPILLDKMQIPVDNFWLYYMPLLVISMVSAFGSAFIAEKHKKYKAVLQFGAIVSIFSAIIALSSLLLSQVNLADKILLIAIYLFFIPYNIFEAILPSLIIKLSYDNSRGASSGMLNLFHFCGSFLGAVLAGTMHESFTAAPFFILLVLGIFSSFSITKKFFQLGHA